MTLESTIELHTLVFFAPAFDFGKGAGAAFFPG